MVILENIIYTKPEYIVLKALIPKNVTINDYIN